MRIGFFVDNYFPYICGVGVSANNLAKSLRELGHTVYIITFRIDGFNYPKDKNLLLLNAHRLPGKKGKDLCLYFNLHYKRCAKKLEKYNLDIIHIQTEFSISQIALELSKRQKIPVVYTYHTLWNEYCDNAFKGASKLVYFFMYHIFLERPLKRSSEIIFPSEKGKDTAKLEKRKIKANATIYPTMLYPESFEIAKEDEIKIKKIKEKYQLNGKKVILYLGRVSPEKKIFELANDISKIMDQNGDVVFLIVGTGPYYSTLKKEIFRLKHHEKMFFVGQVDNSEVKLYYHLSDIFSTFSSFETQGLTYLEALLSKSLLVVKDDPCLKGLIENGENGYTIKSHEEYIEEVLKLLNEDNNEVREKGFKKALNYSPSNWGKAVEKIYERALQK